MKNIFLLFLLLFSFYSTAWSTPRENLPQLYQNLIQYEQIYNDRVENTKIFTSIMQNDLDPQYLPEKQPVFKLDTLLVPKSDVTIIDAAKSWEKKLTVRIGEKEFVPFYVHPESRELYKNEIDKYQSRNDLWATPTSSHRSMIIWSEVHPESPLYIKLSLNKSIGDALRILTKGQIERAATVSYLLQTMNLAELKKDGIYFIDEPFHVYLNSTKTGYTVRTMPDFPEGSELMPMFALYSRRNGKRPLLADLIEKSGVSAKTFVRTRILQPMISHMVKLAFEEGLIGDPHEQNVAIRLQDGKWTGEFYYRDLGGFDINPDLRTAAGKNMQFIPASFNAKYLKPERADLMDKMMSYLLNSNFFALQKALRDHANDITKDWIKTHVLRQLSAEIYLRTGVWAETESAMKAAITRYVNASRKPICRRLFL